MYKHGCYYLSCVADCFVRFLGIGAAKISDEAAGRIGSATLIFTKCKKTVRYVGQLLLDFDDECRRKCMRHFIATRE